MKSGSLRNRIMAGYLAVVMKMNINLFALSGVLIATVSFFACSTLEKGNEKLIFCPRSDEQTTRKILKLKQISQMNISELEKKMAELDYNIERRAILFISFECKNRMKFEVGDYYRISAGLDPSGGFSRHYTVVVDRNEMVRIIETSNAYAPVIYPGTTN